MPVPFFLAFIGSLLGCSIALAFVVKNMAEGFALGGKKPFLYGSVSAVVASLVAYLTSYISTNPFQVFWFFGGVFLLFGIVHIRFIHRRYFYAHTHNRNKVLVAEVLFGIAVILFTVVMFASLQYFLKGSDFLFYPLLMSTLLFFVPLLVFHSFRAGYAIPAAVFPTWQYPLHQPIQLPEDNRPERILVIGFELAKKRTDRRKTYFRVRAPETWKLGDLFYHFINEHNEPHNQNIIEYTDEAHEPYEWWFYIKRKWYQTQKILQPEFSVRENGIQEDTIIICERNVNAARLSKT